MAHVPYGVRINILFLKIPDHLNTFSCLCVSALLENCLSLVLVCSFYPLCSVTATPDVSNVSCVNVTSINSPNMTIGACSNETCSGKVQYHHLVQLKASPERLHVLCYSSHCHLFNMTQDWPSTESDWSRHMETFYISVMWCQLLSLNSLKCFPPFLIALSLPSSSLVIPPVQKD